MQTLLDLAARDRGRLAHALGIETEASAKVLPWKQFANAGAFALTPEMRTEIRRLNASFEVECAAAPTLFRELLSYPPERREEAIEEESRFRTLAFCELLLREARKASFEAPEAGERLARLSLALSTHLDTGKYGHRVLQELKARIWSEIANVRRLASDFQGAEDMLKRAEGMLAETSDRLEVARILSLKATFCKDRRQFDEALDLRDRAVNIYRRFGERHSVGRELTNKASDLLEMGEPESAIECLKSAVKLLDPALEPKAVVSAHHNLILALSEQERFLEASEAYVAARSLYSQADPALQSRGRWLQGRIAAGLGHLKEAERTLQSVREDFKSRDIPYDYALVSLDLALVYARQNRTVEVKQLATEMVPIFKSRQIHREGLAALTLFRQAVEQETLTVGTLRKIIDRLEKAPRRA